MKFKPGEIAVIHHPSCADKGTQCALSRYHGTVCEVLRGFDDNFTLFIFDEPIYSVRLCDGFDAGVVSESDLRKLVPPTESEDEKVSEELTA
jgi:hypothetical protein